MRESETGALRKAAEQIIFAQPAAVAGGCDGAISQRMRTLGHARGRSRSAHRLHTAHQLIAAHQLMQRMDDAALLSQLHTAHQLIAAHQRSRLPAHIIREI
ncbi:MAG: hypothetical protein IVW56_12270 [Candidatus Binataceae bacterium]|nr:hypothetical protein [Candidatus Binataceae bacterium]